MTKAKSLVVLTKASSGIGAATARAFSQLGHPFSLLARRFENLKAPKLPHAITAEVDVTCRESVNEAVTVAEQNLGKKQWVKYWPLKIQH